MIDTNVIFQEQSPNKNKDSSQEEENPLSSIIENLLKIYQQEQEKNLALANQPRLRVGETLGSIAWIYEKIRNAIDYKGEHLLRRNAIERILRRLFWEKSSNTIKLANHLIRELIWARYLKNDSIQKSKIDKVAKILEKYSQLGFEKQWRDWLLGLVSCEIEEELVPSLFYIEAYTQAMYAWFLENFEWKDENIPQAKKNIQIFIAIHRALPKSDDSRIRYHFFKLLYPHWHSADEKLIAEVRKNLFEIHQQIENQLNYPLQLPLYRLIQKHTAPFQILRDIIDGGLEGAGKILKNPQKLELKIREICSKRYAQIKTRVNRGIIRSIIYIFVTKVVLAFALEIPYEIYIIKRLNPVPIAINTLVSPVLMFLVGLSIKRPNEANTERIIERVKGFVYPRRSVEKTGFSLMPTPRGGIRNKVFSTLYITFFLLITSGLAYGLAKLHFNIISALVFFIFLSLVLLFSYRVRFAASELLVTGDKEGFFSHLFSNVTLPFLNIGVWLSRGLSKLNFLIIFFDFLIEAPLKIIIEVVDEWTSFIREKREEVIEVPET